MFDANHMYGGVSIYARSDSAVREKPSSSLYKAGVLPRYTAPAKWWNWLFYTICSGLVDGLNDKKSISTEMTGVLDLAELTPSNSDHSDIQYTQSITVIAHRNVRDYDLRAVNTPRASGTTIILPDTELL